MRLYREMMAEAAATLLRGQAHMPFTTRMSHMKMASYFMLVGFSPRSLAFATILMGFNNNVLSASADKKR